MKKMLYLVFILALFSGCKDKPNLWIQTIPLGDDVKLIEDLAQLTRPCRNPLNYIPDLNNLKHTSLKVVKVNVHIMQNAEGKGNLQGEWGKKYVKEILLSCNGNLLNNAKMRLPLGNDTPVIPTRYTYELWPTTYIPGDDGIYYHRDEEMYYNINRGKNKNIYKRNIFEKYGIQKDSVLNIFVQDVHLDSLKSSNFDPKSNGVAFSTWVKAANWYDAVRDTQYINGKVHLPLKWVPAGLLNHEIGHVFNLRHAWRSDQCDDTPEHENCWSSTGVPPCVVASNNIMDYNSTLSALTPCQLGRVHMSMMTNDIKRNLLKKDWCDLNVYKNIVVKEDLIWNDCKTVQGHIIIEDGARLVMRCKTSLPSDAEIIVHPGGELVLQGAHLYNDCGGLWKGIKTLSEGKRVGKVSYLGDSNKIEHTEYPILFEKADQVRS